MKTFLSAIICSLTISCFGQVTWSENIAPIVYDNCTPCHRPEGIGPFSLIEYSDAVNYSIPILNAVESNYMPPYTADVTYQSYSHERVLSPEEKQAIFDWIAEGNQEGNPDLAPPPPVYNDNGFITAAPDLELIMEPYTSNANEFFDDYICISLPSGLTEDKKLRAFEVIPGNTAIVHHCLVYIDETGTYPTTTSGVCNGPTDGLIGGYTPGTLPTVFPSDGDDLNLGVTIPAGSNIVLALHYPHTSAGEVDQTKIRMYFYDEETEIREVYTDPIVENWNFNIEANTVEEVTAEYSFIPNDVSILSVFPHMHLIGHYIESYGVTLENDTIPFVRINHWDFEWQEFFFFQNMQHVPAWTTIHGIGLYDNTDANPHNPNDPPIDIGAGLNTTDEMFLVYFHYLEYEEGDELIDLEELTSLPSSLTEAQLAEGTLNVYPNPSDENIKFEVALNKQAIFSLYIYDYNGRVVEKIIEGDQVPPGVKEYNWDVTEQTAGIYYYSLLVNGSKTSGKLIVR